MVDSPLSQLSGRASITILNDSKTVSRPRRGEKVYNRSQQTPPSIIGQVNAQAGLGFEAHPTTATLVAPHSQWTQFGPEGYPLTPSYLTASGNHLDAGALAGPHQRTQLFL
jgi:hypothetical protein